MADGDRGGTDKGKGKDRGDQAPAASDSGDEASGEHPSGDGVVEPAPPALSPDEGGAGRRTTVRSTLPTKPPPAAPGKNPAVAVGTSPAVQEHEIEPCVICSRRDRIMRKFACKYAVFLFNLTPLFRW